MDQYKCMPPKIAKLFKEIKIFNLKHKPIN